MTVAPRKGKVGLGRMVLPDGKCTLKRQKDRYDTKSKAEAAMAQVNRSLQNYPESAKIKRVYKCPSEGCGGWHLTSREKFDAQQSRMFYLQRNPQEGSAPS